MPNETIEAPTSQAAPAKAESGDAKKSDNVKGHSVAQALLQREAATAAKKAPPAESVADVAKAAEKIAETPASEETKTVTSKTDSQAKAEPESDEALSNSISPEIQEKIDKRIGKEVAKRTALERELAELKGKIAATPAPVVQPAPVAVTPDNPLANINSIPELEKQLQTAKETKLWAQEQLDREDIDQGVKVGDVVYSKAQLKQVVRNVERQIEMFIPDRARFLNQRAQSEKVAHETFEWLKDPSSDQFKAFQRAYADPDFRFNQSPNGYMAAAAAVEGLSGVQLRKAIADQNKGTKAVDKRQVPPASQLAGGAAPTAPQREAGSSRAVAALASELANMKKGHGVRVKDVTKFLAARDQTHR